MDRTLVRSDFEHRLAKLDGFGVLNQDLSDDPFDLGFDLVHDFHRLNDADDRVGIDLRADFDIAGRLGRWRPIKSADHG